MGKLTNLLKKKWFYLLLIAIVLSLFFILNNRKSRNISLSQPGSAISEIASFGEISPGKTSLEKVNELLGFSVGTSTINGKEALDYRTSNQFRNHQVVAENNTVKIVKEVVNIEDNKNTDTVRSVYGIAPYILYEQVPESVFDLYVYPKNGIAYLGHEDGTVLEIWYFEPTIIETFISTWATNYSERKFSGKPRY